MPAATRQSRRGKPGRLRLADSRAAKRRWFSTDRVRRRRLNGRSLNREGVGVRLPLAAGSPSGSPQVAVGRDHLAINDSSSAGQLQCERHARLCSDSERCGRIVAQGAVPRPVGLIELDRRRQRIELGSAGDTGSGSNSIARGSGTSAARTVLRGHWFGIWVSYRYAGRSNTFREGGARSEPIGSSGSDGASALRLTMVAVQAPAASGGGMNLLPDLEPAGDGGSSPSRQLRAFASGRARRRRSRARRSGSELRRRSSRHRRSRPGLALVPLQRRPVQAPAIGAGSVRPSSRFRHWRTGQLKGAIVDRSPTQVSRPAHLRRPPAQSVPQAPGGLGSPTNGSPASSAEDRAFQSRFAAVEPRFGCRRRVFPSPAFGMPSSSSSSASSSSSTGGIPWTRRRPPAARPPRRALRSGKACQLGIVILAMT